MKDIDKTLIPNLPSEAGSLVNPLCDATTEFWPNKDVNTYPYPTGGVPNINARRVDVTVPNAPTALPSTLEAVWKIADSTQASKATPPAKKHNHYFKDVSHLTHIDVYRVLDIFKVTDQAIGHALKKLLVAGGRGAGKDINKDIQEAIDSLVRWQEMQRENTNVR